MLILMRRERFETVPYRTTNYVRTNYKNRFAQNRSLHRHLLAELNYAQQKIESIAKF